MSSITLYSQSFRPASQRAGGSAASGLAHAIARLAALLLGAAVSAARRMKRRDAAGALRERAEAYLATDAGYAAELRAAADLHQKLAERA